MDPAETDTATPNTPEKFQFFEAVKIAKAALLLPGQRRAFAKLLKSQFDKLKPEQRSYPVLTVMVRVCLEEFLKQYSKASRKTIPRPAVADGDESTIRRYEPGSKFSKGDFVSVGEEVWRAAAETSEAPSSTGPWVLLFCGMWKPGTAYRPGQLVAYRTTEKHQMWRCMRHTSDAPHRGEDWDLQGENWLRDELRGKPFQESGPDPVKGARHARKPRRR